MEQRTCNIIMCCKGHCKLGSENDSMLDSIAVYMSNECRCPKEIYTGSLMKSILCEALYDYMNDADNPGFELRQLFYQYVTREPDLMERICTMFQLIQIREDTGYINGFTEDLIKQSDKDLGNG